MTLIVGYRCSDGIVIGADSAVTYDNQTIQQPTVKLEGIAGRIIVGVSGPVGLGQKYKAEIRHLAEKNELRRDPARKQLAVTDSIARISERMLRHLRKDLRTARAAAPVVGAGYASVQVRAYTLVALPIADEAHLIQFNDLAIGEEFAEPPFVSVGSGQNIADPFLAFLRRVLWKQRPINVANGVFTVFWCLEHAIRTAPGFLAKPIQVMHLQRDRSSDWKVHEYTREELEQHSERVTAGEEYISRFDVSGGKATDAPKPS